ncbi:Neurotrypsin (Serine protease 12) [Durusdinium trenchii]|uniref:Neurotrypsin (Serine protease 12) n=1 Tax=Durusdinium trenchii TaxID=1381693 RepID=A0ABP0R5X3_9DINO
MGVSVLSRAFLAAPLAGHVGLLELETASGQFGTVCGVNGAAAEVACRQLGYDYGVASSSSCAQYGGASVCGAAGSPVAAKNLKCSGSEMSVDECGFEIADNACLGHSSDAVVFCGMFDKPTFKNGALRLIGLDGAPALPREAGRLEMFWANAWAPVCKEGFSSGTAKVACQAMGFTSAAGFSGCDGALCGPVVVKAYAQQAEETAQALSGLQQAAADTSTAIQEIESACGK